MNRIACAFALLVSVGVTPALAQGDTSTSSEFGVLVMAHGGSDDWNAGVLSAVEPLKNEYSLEVAFGMADATSIQQGVSKLEAAGAKRIAVIRLFISGDSWYERTRQIVGLDPGAPPKPQISEHVHDDHANTHSMAFWVVESDASFAVSREGLVEAAEMGETLVQRARDLSQNPAEERVMILAHGPEDDAENERWIASMELHAAAVRDAMPFAHVEVETLREDWPEKRALAEQRVRQFVGSAAEAGDKAIVIPFRVQGFGPYAEVLSGLDYVSDGRGLVPHPGVTEWIARQIASLDANGFTGD
jgi:sirohydrochlorin ferrochelatase